MEAAIDRGSSLAHISCRKIPRWRLARQWPGRVVIFSFPSETAALAWYNDPDYQALSELRRAGTELQFITLVHGLPPRN